MTTMKSDAKVIIDHAIAANLPEEAVKNALKQHSFSNRIRLLAVGKAAWRMAEAAQAELGAQIESGLVITKYEHSQGPIGNMTILEAGHPLTDENSIRATAMAVDMAESLGEEDELLFLLSGGGSALFEKPLPGLDLEDIVEVNRQLLASGANIVEMNMIRKRLSAVKAGRFAQIAAPARIFMVVLSDVIGDRLDAIASGPAAPDLSTAAEALQIMKKYKLSLSPAVSALLEKETPKHTDNVETVITGSVSTLCAAAADKAAELGYTPYILCTEMGCEAKDAGSLLAAMARNIGEGQYAFSAPCALIMGGETVVHLKGNGKGGRNQELALAAAEGIAGLENVLVFSVGSDGTDGPTNAAGGMVDGHTMAKLAAAGIDLQEALGNNDAYHALQAADCLVITGPTGTNVNDVTIALCR